MWGKTIPAALNPTYYFTLSNLGNASDSFTLEVSGTWTTTLSADSTGELEAGETFTFVAYVTIPQEAEDGAQDIAVITATSDFDTGVSASAELTTTAVVTTYHTYLALVMKN